MMMIYEVYKNKEGGTPIFQEYGAWFEETGILENTDLDKYMRRRNLQVRINYNVHIKPLKKLNFRASI